MWKFKDRYLRNEDEDGEEYTPSKNSENMQMNDDEDMVQYQRDR